jgi:threonine synthase
MNRLICTRCGTGYPLDVPRWRCDCGSVLDIEFEPVFDLARIRDRKPTMWRYREAIPVCDDAHVVSLDEGFTPLLPLRLEGVQVWIKQDHLFSTGSYKDRGAAVLISKVRELGVSDVVEDSSGNAGCAVAAYCARAGVHCTIYVPGDTSPAKLAQIRLYGARLERVPGTRRDTADAVWEVAQGTYYASHSWNPFFLHGTKTFAFEVCEQLGWRSPDVLVLPAGNGTLLLGAYIGFKELLRAGIVDRMPQIVAVQAARCAPLYEAFRGHADEVRPIEPRPTMAEGIAIANPIRGQQILAAVRESGGTFMAVEEAEIERSLRDMCEQGFYIEPTSAATIAGLARYLRQQSPGTHSATLIVSTFTGHGLKATEKMSALL